MSYTVCRMHIARLHKVMQMGVNLLRETFIHESLPGFPWQHMRVAGIACI